MIFDLHCDLLLHLANGGKIDDPASRCSLPQLNAGGVRKQILAIFTETGPNSTQQAQTQIVHFHTLAKKHPGRFLPAYENASGFCAEDEPLDLAFARLDKFRPVYVSLTWNKENRFGGGCGSQKRLTPDGRILINFLNAQKIPIDLSHASDPLAYDILQTADRVLASHSNFRSIHPHERNLPDEIAQEIINRKGVIGLVFYSKFLRFPEQIQEHIAHANALGGTKSLAFGADFFPLDALQDVGTFFPELSDASCYPLLLEKLPLELRSPISFENASRFFDWP